METLESILSALFLTSVRQLSLLGLNGRTSSLDNLT